MSECSVSALVRRRSRETSREADDRTYLGWQGGLLDRDRLLALALAAFLLSFRRVSHSACLDYSSWWSQKGRTHGGKDTSSQTVPGPKGKDGTVATTNLQLRCQDAQRPGASCQSQVLAFATLLHATHILH